MCNLTSVLLTRSLLIYAFGVNFNYCCVNYILNHSLQIYRNTLDSFYIDLVSCNLTVILVVVCFGDFFLGFSTWIVMLLVNKDSSVIVIT